MSLARGFAVQAIRNTAGKHEAVQYCAKHWRGRSQATRTELTAWKDAAWMIDAEYESLCAFAGIDRAKK